MGSVEGGESHRSVNYVMLGTKEEEKRGNT